MHVQIDLFEPHDQEETSTFMKSIFSEMGWTPQPDEGLDNLADFFHLPQDGFLLLVKDHDKVIGTGGVVKIDSNKGLIKRFYIYKKFRNQGIGRQLLSEIVSFAKKYNFSRLVLDVAKTSSPAIHLYEKFGFKQYNQEPIPGWPESNMSNTHFFYFLDVK